MKYVLLYYPHITLKWNWGTPSLSNLLYITKRQS